MKRIFQLIAHRALLVLFTTGGVACSADENEDAGVADTGTLDFGSADSGTQDAGLVDSGMPDQLVIEGAYVDNWGMDHTITATVWLMMGSRFNITQYNNDGEYSIAQNGANNAFSPNLWSRFDWTMHAGSLWYCQTIYDAADEDAALSTPRGEDSDPANSGCGGFSWSKLIAVPEIVGDYLDSWGMSHVVTSTIWDNDGSRYIYAHVDNDADHLIGQNAPDHPFNPNLWSRFDWTMQSGTLWYCQTTYDAADEAAARATSRADDTDPAATGCGTYAWSSLIPQ